MKISKIIIELEYKDGTIKTEEYPELKGSRMYLEYMRDPKIFTGRKIEVYEDGHKERRASFCSGTRRIYCD